MSNRIPWPLAGLAFLLGTSCNPDSGDGVDSQTTADSGQTTNELALDIPDWDTFAPPQADQPPAPVGPPTTELVTDTLYNLEGDDEVVETSIPNVTFQCESQVYDMVTNPDALVMLGSDASVMWPGALVQGRSFREGAEFAPLPIMERAPLEVSISALPGDNVRVVENPTPGTVADAIGTMVRDAAAGGFATPSNVSFEQSEYHSEAQFALDTNISGRYLGFEGSVSVGVDTNRSKTTVAAQLLQTLYTVEVPLPSSPEGFFSDAFTQEHLDEQAALGRIGANNPPLYVSKVVYGRMMTFSVTAAASASEIQAAIEASYQTLSGEVGGGVTVRQQALLDSATIRLAQLGGDQASALRAIRAGNLAEYFDEAVEITAAAPLQFTLRTLTGQVARVSEPGEYTVTTCSPQLPGSFDFEGEQQLEAQLSSNTLRHTAMADIDGDGIDDLVVNELRSGTQHLNRVVVAFGNEDGTLEPRRDSSGALVDAVNTVEDRGWEQFDLVVIDSNGDGLDDLVWNRRSRDNNDTYWALSNGDGTFSWGSGHQHVSSGNWEPYEVFAFDTNGDSREDLVFNRLLPTNQTFVMQAQPDGSFRSEASEVADLGDDWDDYETHIGDVNADGCTDFIWNAPASDRNNTYVGLGDCSNSGYSQVTAVLNSTNGWTPYLTVTGNFDGEAGTDLAWFNPYSDTLPLHRAFSIGDGRMAFELPNQEVDPTGWYNNDGDNVDVVGADVDNSGTTDLVINQIDTDNTVLVGLGGAGRDFTFPAAAQVHPTSPAAGWPVYNRLVGDVNGDAKQDIIWTHAASPMRTFVALAR